MKQFLGTVSVPQEMTRISSKPGDRAEVMSGRLKMIQTSNAGMHRKVIGVYVRVYTSNFEHYAVIYNDHKHCGKGVHVGLKHSAVTKSDSNESEFRVILDNSEGTGIVFQANSSCEVDEWVSVLQSSVIPGSPPKMCTPLSMSPAIPRPPLLPTLSEEDEDD